MKPKPTLWTLVFAAAAVVAVLAISGIKIWWLP